MKVATEQPWVIIVGLGLGGFGLGMGLALGAFLGRAISHYVRGNGNGR